MLSCTHYLLILSHFSPRRVYNARWAICHCCVYITVLSWVLLLCVSLIYNPFIFMILSPICHKVEILWALVWPWTFSFVLEKRVVVYTREKEYFHQFWRFCECWFWIYGPSVGRTVLLLLIVDVVTDMSVFYRTTCMNKTV